MVTKESWIGKIRIRELEEYKEYLDPGMNWEVVLVIGESDAEVKTLGGNEVLKWKMMGIVVGPPGGVEVT